jgi:hypothetical protein
LVWNSIFIKTPLEMNRTTDQRMMRALFAMITALCCTASLWGQQTYYVTTTGDDAANSGTSWSEAFRTLHKALASANSGDEIWIAKGTYYPDEGPGIQANSVAEHFYLKAGVEIYGGFEGTEPPAYDLNLRDFEANTTFLSGDIDQDGTLSGNSNNIFYNSWDQLDSSALLDGVTIDGGNTSPSTGFSSIEGGGMFLFQTSPRLVNCTFSNNYSDGLAGGLYLNRASPQLLKCRFIGNQSGFSGGGMWLGESSPLIEDCIFENNSTAKGGGGLSINLESSPTVKNCIFINNESIEQYGGAIDIFRDCAPSMSNCLFYGNEAALGGEDIWIFDSPQIPKVINCTLWGKGQSSNKSSVRVDRSDLEITNSIIWNVGEAIEIDRSSVTIQHSIIANSYNNGNWNSSLGIDGGGNLNQNPLLKNPANQKFGLQSCSPAIDAGTNANAPDEDLLGNPRPVDGDGDTNATTDIGAYEYQSVGGYGTHIYVDLDATGGNDNGTSWEDAFLNLQDALQAAVSCGVNQIWVAAGTYRPSAYPANCSGCASNRDYTFLLPNGVAVYGGFAGTEDPATFNLTDRDFTIHETILSGDIGIPDDPSDNVYHVVVSASSNTRLDGFTVTGGNADVNEEITVNGTEISRGLGGGIITLFGSNTLTNNTISGNSALSGGGGIFTRFGSNTLTNNTVSGNTASSGGGIVTLSGSNTLTNNTVSGNTASGGGGIYLARGTNTMINNTVTGNQAISGGGIYTDEGNHTLINNTVTGNEADYGGGVYTRNASVSTSIRLINNTVSGNTTSVTFSGAVALRNNIGNNTMTNNIIWGNNSGFVNSSNTLVANNIIQGGYSSGTNNFDADPLFVYPLSPGLNIGGDYRLLPCSPAINAGSNSAVPTSVGTDLDGSSRIFGATVDIGAYEFQDTPTPVVARCKSPTVMLDANGEASLLATDLDDGSTGCGTLGFSVDDSDEASFGCSDVGTPVALTLTVTDNRGQQNTCEAIVTVEDTVAPQALCQDVTVQLDVSGSASVTDAQIDNGSNDACGIDALSLSQSSFGCSGTGANTVTLTVTDLNGNFTSCTATVTVEDNNPPVAICANPTVDLTSDGITTVDAAFFDGGSSAICDGLDFSASMTEFDCDDVGNTYDITLTVTSQSSGLSDACTASVTVEDPNSFCCAPPMAVCEDITVQLDASGSASITPADIGSSSTAECGLDSDMLSVTGFDCSNTGAATTVTYTITDINGDSDNCTATVTVEDNVAPAALCQNVTVQLDANGNGSTTANDVDNGSSDACGVASLSLSQTSFGCAEVGANTETLTVTDVNGNVSTCSTTITVEDNVAPVALCQDITVQLDANGNGSTTANDVDNGSNDACGVASLSLSQTSFGCAEVGANAETLTVTDVNGNVSTCSTTVTVEDNVAPAAACLNTIVEIQPDGTYNLQQSDVYDAANSTDNCSIATVSFPPTIFDCDDLDMTFPVTVTVTDPSGNSDNCTANVTVDASSALPNGWAANDIGANPQGTAYSFDPCTNSGEFSVTGSGANGTNPFADALAFASQNLCGDFTITTKVESVTPGGYGGIMVRESTAPGAKQFSLFSNLTNILLVQIRTATNAPKQQQLHNRPFPTWIRVQRMGQWLMGYYSPDGINFQYLNAVSLPSNNCLEVGLAAFTNFGGPSTAVFSNVSVTGGSALAGSGVPSFVQQGEQLPNSDLQLPISAELFPNPTSDRFTLAFPQSLNGDATATLRNQIGQVMAQRQLKPGDVTTEWNVSALPSGLYFMEVRQEGMKPQVLRVVKTQ